MTFTLSQVQLDELTVLANAASGQSDTQSGVWTPVYDKLYEFITDASSGMENPAAGVDHQVWLWVRGARAINENTGPFAELIREYTQIQHEIRYGATLSDAELGITVWELR